MFIPSTFKRPVSSWKALNLRKTLLMASSVRLKPLNCSRSEERFSRNAETDLVCRLLLEKKNSQIGGEAAGHRKGGEDDAELLNGLLAPGCGVRFHEVLREG